MQKIFICQGCCKEKHINPRLKGNQQFCGEPRCQRARKAQWQKTKMKTDAVYRAQELDCLREWRRKRPLHRYQREYRETHPEYVAENRRKQRIRNWKRHRQNEAEMIVRMNAMVVELTVLQHLSRHSGPSPP